MNRKHVPASSLLAVLLVAVAPRLLGQGTATPTPAAPAPAPAEETVVLSPFVVEASEDADTYRATATLAGNRIRTDLKDVGSAITVVTQKFLTDTNSKSAEDLLVYTTGTEVAGQGGNYLGQGDKGVLTDTSRNQPIANTRVRGLAEADNTRDFFLSDIPWDSYNVGRVDILRGPNSILFGIGSPAGIVNSSLNTASFKDSNKVEIQIGRFGSYRATLDVNKVLTPDELAVRVAVLNEKTNFRQDPAYEKDRRVYAALKWDPKFFAAAGATSINMKVEAGKIDANRPRGTPPLDAITPWFSQGKPTFDARTVNDDVNALPSAAQRQLYGSLGNRVWDGVATAFDDGVQGVTFATTISAYPNHDAGVPTSAGVGNNTFKGYKTYDGYANALYASFTPNLPTYTQADLLAGAGTIGAYKAKSLTDRSIFDFYNSLLEGPNKNEYNDFNSFNLSASQEFWDRQLGLELVYDRQDAKWGHTSLISGDGSVISVDIIDTALDGSPNPNVGRPVTLSNGYGGGVFRAESVKESFRATSFLNLDFAEKMSGTIGKVLGRHVFTGVWSTFRDDHEQISAKRYFISQDYAPNDNKAVNNAARDNIFLNYLGPDLRSGPSTASGLGLKGIQGEISVHDTPINVYNNVTNAWETVNLHTVDNSNVSKYDIEQPGEAYTSLNEIDSAAFVWQGYMFDGTVVPMFGWRNDKPLFKRQNADSDRNGGLVLSDTDWRNLSDIKGDGESGDTKTYSVAVHMPESWRDNMPGRLGVSLYYNKSDNFQPDTSRRDIFGNPVASPTGETKEYGFGISAFDDKVTLRVTHYETNVFNATLDGAGINSQYLIGANEAWGQQAAIYFRNSVVPNGAIAGQANTLYGTSSDGHQVTWRPAGPLQGNVTDGFTYSQAVLDATYAREQASIDAWFATQVPANFQAAWQLDNYDPSVPTNYAGVTNFGASGLVVTGDTFSKGTEFELVASNVVRGLDVSMNAAKTSASRANPAKSYIDWITQRWAEYQGPAGDMRLWGTEDDFAADPDHGGETARGKYARETMAGYYLFRALEGADVPELRPWRFNVVTNYTFQPDSRLKGTNIGGSLRWQQASVTGFPLKVNDTNDGIAFDVDHPFKGKADNIIDLWVGYQRQISEKIKWRLQLNVRNAFADDKLVPVTVQPDGSPAAFRIPEPRVWTITNSFEF